MRDGAIEVFETGSLSFFFSFFFLEYLFIHNFPSLLRCLMGHLKSLESNM